MHVQRRHSFIPKVKRARTSGVAAPAAAAGRPFWNAAVAAHAKGCWQPTNVITTPIPSSGWHRVTETRPLTTPHIAELHATVNDGRKKKRTRKKRKTGEETPVVSLVIRKHKLVATATQRAILKKWVGAARWTYNQAIDWINSKKPTDKEGQQAMRDAFVKNGAFKTENTWMLQVPNDVRAGAYRDALDAYVTNCKKVKAHPGAKFTMRYRSVKSTSQSIYICHRAFHDSNTTIYPKFLPGSLRFHPPLPPKIEHDCRLQLTATGDYYLCVPIPAPTHPKVKSENQAPILRVAAIDPGVRTFATVYDPTGVIYEFGKGDVTVLERYCHALDRLQSKVQRTGVTHKRRYRLRKAMARLRTCIRNLVDDMHKKTAAFLADGYDLLLLPEFATQRMVKRSAKANLGSKVARAMLTWAHYRFRCHLQQRAERSDCTVKIVDESFTTKTCGGCGAINPTVGGSKTFVCPSCGHMADRDVNAARNILLRNATEIEFDLRLLSPGTPPARVVHGSVD